MCNRDSTNNSWRSVLLFRLSGNNWFGVYADYLSNTATDNDSNAEVAIVIVLNAFSQLLQTSVRANYGNSPYSRCGHDVYMLWGEEGDYIMYY